MLQFVFYTVSLFESDTEKYDHIYVTQHVLQSPVMHCVTSLSNLCIHILEKHTSTSDVGWPSDWLHYKVNLINGKNRILVSKILGKTWRLWHFKVAKIIPSCKHVTVSWARPFKLGYIPLNISQAIYLSNWCKNSTKKFLFLRHFSLVLNSSKKCICKILMRSLLLLHCRYGNAVPASFSILLLLAVYVKWAEGLSESFFFVCVMFQ